MKCVVCQETIINPIQICCQHNLHSRCAILLNKCQDCKHEYDHKLQKSLNSKLLPVYQKYKETIVRREAKQKTARKSIQLSALKIAVAITKQQTQIHRTESTEDKEQDSQIKVSKSLLND